MRSDSTPERVGASIQATATGELNGLQLPKLFPGIAITNRGAGAISGALALTAQGNSVAHMLGSANGNIGLIMGPGHISNLPPLKGQSAPRRADSGPGE